MAAASQARYSQSTKPPSGTGESTARLQKFFWFIGGFDSETLARKECRAVRPKYSSMGAIILLTALIAGCSGGYAIQTIFQSAFTTVILGVLWCLMILALDRFLVSSTRKLAVINDFFKFPNAAPSYRTKTPWLVLSLRLPIALAIGFVVSKPIEVRLLRPLILSYEDSRRTAELEEVPENSDIKRQEVEIQRVRGSIQAKEHELEKAVQILNAELDGHGSPKPGRGPVAIEKAITRDRLKSQLDDLIKDKGAKEARRGDDIIARTRDVGKNAETREHRSSVISDLVTIQKLSAGDTPDLRDRSPVISYASLFLTLLFVLIECMPVIAKALSSFDPYDARLQEMEDGATLTSLIEVRRKYAESGMSD